MPKVKLKHSNCDEKCPIEATLNIIGTKWTSLIIRDLLLAWKSSLWRFTAFFRWYQSQNLIP